MRSLRLALVSAFPPSTGPLSEHAWHLVESLKQDSRVDHIYVLADASPGATDQRCSKATVFRCWKFGTSTFPVDIVRCARQLRVDALWFNLHLSSAGNTKLSRLAGLAAPLVTRMFGFPTLVTIHNLLGPTDLSETRINASRLDVWGGHLATRLLRGADLVCVTRPEYVDLLQRRYGVARTRYIPLGTPGTPLKAIHLSKGRERLLAFGHFGSNKRLEDLIDVVGQLSAQRQGLHLCIAGKSSRYASDYLDVLQLKYADQPYVRFLGYVPENQVPALFQSAAISVLPYGTLTGMSSVALQSAMYGAPILASDIEGFRLLEKEGLRLSFYKWGEKDTLRVAIETLLDRSEDALQRDAHANLKYCERQRIELVTTEYLTELGTLAGSLSTADTVWKAISRVMKRHPVGMHDNVTL